MVKPIITNFQTVAPMILQKYERYLPTAFDESMTLLEKVNKVIIYMNQIGEITNQVVDQWNKVMEWVLNEGLEDEVLAKLSVWLEDGTLEKIINENIFGDLNNKINENTVRILDFMNVKHHGAKGDFNPFTMEGNDDTNAIQALLDIAKTSPHGGVKVFIPSGRYKLTKPLIVYKNTSLVIDEFAILDKRHNGNMLMNSEPNAQHSGYYGNGNILVDGGVFENNGHLIQEGTCMVFGHAKNIAVRNVTIKNVSLGHGIEVNSIQKGVISNNRLFGFHAGTTRTFSEAIQIDLATQGALPWFGYHDSTPCKDIYVLNNMIGRSDELPSWGRGIGSHNGVIGKWHENIVVKNNTIRDVLEWGIRAYSWNHSTIEGNQLFSCRGGISVNSIDSTKSEDTKTDQGIQTNQSQYASSVFVLNNKIVGGGGYGSALVLRGDKTGILYESILSNNIVSDFSGLGVYVLHASKFKVNDNILTGITSTGISTNESENYIVSGNLLERISANGITGFKGNHFKINDNHLKYTDQHGIIVSETCNNVSVENNMITGVGKNSDIHQHIRVTTDVSRININGNTLRDIFGSVDTYESQYGIYVTATIQDALIVGNFAKGCPIQVDSGASASLFGNMTDDSFF